MSNPFPHLSLEAVRDPWPKDRAQWHAEELRHLVSDTRVIYLRALLQIAFGRVVLAETTTPFSAGPCDFLSSLLSPYRSALSLYRLELLIRSND